MKNEAVVFHPATDDLVAFLNELVMLDGEFIERLVQTRIECNVKVAEHPTIQTLTGPDGVSLCGLLGLLNGFCGVHTSGPIKGSGPIVARFSEAGELLGFVNSDIDDREQLLRA